MQAVEPSKGHEPEKLPEWCLILQCWLLRSQCLDRRIGDPAPDRRYEPGEIFKDCRECPEMVVVPAGVFTMGSPESEEGRTEFEGPQHRVTFSEPFAVGRFAVSFDEWDACIADGGCNGYKPFDLNWGRGKRPNVSWDDAQAYVSWLKAKTGRDYHLLSEPQREYVTRAGTTTPFWWGTSGP